MNTFKKGDKVIIKHINGQEIVEENNNLRVVGAEAYVKKVYDLPPYLELTIPTHRHYSGFNSYLAKSEELELVQ